MRKHGIDMWVVPMREYNEDPGLLRDHRARDVRRAAPDDLRLLRQVRRGRDSAGARVRRAHRARRHVAGWRVRRAPSTQGRRGDVGRGQQAELWGDEQWLALKSVVEERNPKVIGINRSTVFAFTDGFRAANCRA